MSTPSAHHPDFDIDRVNKEFYRTLDELPEALSLQSTSIRRLGVVIRFALKHEKELKSGDRPLIITQYFNEADFPSDLQLEEDVGTSAIALELVAGFVNPERSDLVVCGIVSIGGPAEEKGPLRFAIGRLIWALTAKVDELFNRHADIFAGTGIQPPSKPIATISEILEAVADPPDDFFETGPRTLH